MRRGYSAGIATALNGIGTPADGDTIVGTGGQGAFAPHPYFGDGRDGSSTVSGAVLWARPMFLAALTLIAGAAINTAGWECRVSGTLDAIAAPTGAMIAAATAGSSLDGGDAVATAAGAAAPAMTFTPMQGTGAAVVGKAGGTAAGTAGSSVTAIGLHQGGTAGAAGAGGAGSSAGGAAGAQDPNPQQMLVWLFPAFTCQGGTSVRAGICGPSGGSGGGDGTAGGGSGGGSDCGGVLAIYARALVLSSANLNAGIFAAKAGRGGHGASPVAGNRGGGGGAGGGGGGVFYGVFGGITGGTHANAIDVSGGAGGNGAAGTGTGTSGAGGAAGFGGAAIVINLSKTTASSQIVATTKWTVGGTAATGATGGVATTAQINLAA